MYTCIDDREGSLRRHLEEINPSAETFGIAGFFAMPVRYQPVDGQNEMVLAPEGQQPRAVLREEDEAGHLGEVGRYKRVRRLLAHVTRGWEAASFSPVGSLALAAAAPFSLARLLLIGFAPVVKQDVRDFVQRRFTPRPHTDFKVPYTPEESATILARTFTSLGTAKAFAPLVLVLGHGAASLNNPFSAAYNCGACGGRDGGPNARLFARVANDPAVRAALARDHGVIVPDDTLFVGAKHNTTTDEIEYYDTERLPASHSEQFWRMAANLDIARGRNALERCHRFLLAARVTTPDAALAHVRRRAVDTAEVRPELNHATNATVVVGRRELTRGAFFDRRAFLPSYDPTGDDARGTLLESVLAPALIVSSVRVAPRSFFFFFFAPPCE